MKNPLKSLVSTPWLWNFVQVVLGAPTFKRELYRSKLKKGSRLLDFGCASGHLADAFSDFDYTGIDLDSNAISSAQERFKDKPNMRFIATDLHSRPFPAASFDEVLFAATAHHLTDDLMRSLLKELHFCLKPGGTIHLFDPVFRPEDRFWQRFFRAIDQGKYSRSTEQIIALIESLRLFEIGTPSYYPPYGALLQDCDFLYLPLKKP